MRRLDVDWRRIDFSSHTDGELAEKLGCSRKTVFRNRRRFGVASAHPRIEIDWHLMPLGKMPDADLARELGVTVEQVVGARRWRGIPRFAETCPCGRRVPPSRSDGRRSHTIYCSGECMNLAASIRKKFRHAKLVGPVGSALLPALFALRRFKADIQDVEERKEPR